MNERDSVCLAQYDLSISHIRKARGALVIEDEQGKEYLLQECTYSLGRIEFEDQILKQLRLPKELQVDTYVPNKENNFITKERNGNSYLLKEWINAKECDVKSIEETKKAIKALALLHKAIREINLENIQTENEKTYDLSRFWEKHYLEMKRTRSFIRKKKKKSKFELLILNTIDKRILQANQVNTHLQKINLEKIPQYLCHGNYNQHHVLYLKDVTLITQFHQMHLGYQISDVYQFLRKIMEKNNWDIQLAHELLSQYEKILPFNKDEKQLLAFYFYYPDKYWKQINHYMNSSKNWIPERYLIKLNQVLSQEEKRKKFLIWIFTKFL